MKELNELINAQNRIIRKRNIQVNWEIQKVRASSTPFERDYHLKKLAELALTPMIGSDKYV